VCNLEAAKGAAEVRENVTVFGGDRADMRRVCGFGGEGHEASPRSICALPSSTSLVFYAFVAPCQSIQSMVRRGRGYRLRRPRRHAPAARR